MKRLLVFCLCMMLVACSKNDSVKQIEIMNESFVSTENIVFNSDDEVIFKQYGSKEMVVLNYEAKERLKELSDNLLQLSTNTGNVIHDDNSIEVKINGKETYYLRDNTLYHEINKHFDGEQVVEVVNSDELYNFALEMIGIKLDAVESLKVDEYHDGYLDSENPIKDEMYHTLTSRFNELEEYLLNAYEQLVNDSKIFDNVNEDYTLEAWGETFEYPFMTLTKYAYSSNDMIKIIVTCEYENDDTSCEYRALISEEVFETNSNIVTSSVEVAMFYEQAIMDLANGIIDENAALLGGEKEGYIQVDMLFNEELKTYQDIYVYLNQFFTSTKSKKLCDMLVNSDYVKLDDGIYVQASVTVREELPIDIKAYKVHESEDEQLILVIVDCAYGYCEWKEYSYVLENDLWLCA